MRNVLKTLAGVTALLLLASLAFARSKADFDKFLKGATDSVANYSSEKYFEKLEFTNTKTKEKKKFSDFDEVDRRVFMLMYTDSLSHQMEDLYNKWKEELKTAEETPDDANEANKKDVTDYLDKLMALRKKNAEKVESMLAELFKKFPDKFTKEEQEHITKTIKEYHDKQSLVKRK